MLKLTTPSKQYRVPSAYLQIRVSDNFRIYKLSRYTRHLLSCTDIEVYHIPKQSGSHIQFISDSAQSEQDIAMSSTGIALGCTHVKLTMSPNCNCIPTSTTTSILEMSIR